MKSAGPIDAVLREVATPQKSFGLALCDTILKPLNIVLGMRKVVLVEDNWVKAERTKNRALIVISYLATIIFSPIMMGVLLFKGRSEEHKLLVRTYQFDKKTRLLGTKVGQLDNLQEERFSIELKQKPGFRFSFTWFGKLKAKELFSQF